LCCVVLCCVVLCCVVLCCVVLCCVVLCCVVLCCVVLCCVALFWRGYKLLTLQAQGLTSGTLGCPGEEDVSAWGDDGPESTRGSENVEVGWGVKGDNSVITEAPQRHWNSCLPIDRFLLAFLFSPQCESWRAKPRLGWMQYRRSCA